MLMSFNIVDSSLKMYLTLFILGLSGFRLCRSLSDSYTLVESRLSPPPDFTFVGPADPNLVIPMRIQLPQNNVSGLIDVLLDVSNPTSNHYGHHLSKAEASRLLILRLRK